MDRLPLAALLALLAAPHLAAATPFLAAPTLEVKARAWLDGLTAEAVGPSIHVRGTLRDNLNQAVPGAQIELRLIPEAGAAPRPLMAKTDPQGQLSATLRAPGEGRHQIEARFSGGSLLGPAEGQAAVEVGRVRVQISADLPAQPSVRRPLSVPITVSLPTGGPGADIPLQITLDGERLPPLRTDRRGRATAQLPAPTPTVHRLTLTVEPGAGLSRARWSGQFHGARPLEVALAYTGPEAPAPGAPLVFRGQVIGAEGEALDVMLLADERPVARVAIDEEGQFTLSVDPDDTGAGEIDFRALSNAQDATFLDGASRIVTVTVPAPPPPSPLWTRIPLALAALSLLLALWRWRPKRAAPRRAPAPTPPAPLPAFEWVKQAEGGPLRISVCDGITGAPLAAAVIPLGPEDPAPDLTAPPPAHAAAIQIGPTGALTLGAEITPHRLWIYRPGYAPACHPCPEGGGVIIRLLPIRAFIQRRFVELLAEAGRPILRFGEDTPAQAGRAMIERGWPERPVRALIAQVEAACFGPTAPDLDALAALQDLLHSLEARA